MQGRKRERVSLGEFKVKSFVLCVLGLLASSCEPNFCLSLEDDRCIRSEKAQPLDTPAGMENDYGCISAGKTPALLLVKQGSFVRERRAILHGLYEDQAQLPDLLSYPSCFYEELGIHIIVIAQGVSVFNILPAHGRSSSILGIIECSLPDIRMTFHHEVFHIMAKKKFFDVDPRDEEKLAEVYAKIAIEYLDTGQKIIPVRHVLSNLK